MYHSQGTKRKRAAVKKELERLAGQERRLERAAARERPGGLPERLEQKLPERVREALEKAFCKAFRIVFEKGTRVIEKTVRKESREEEYAIRQFAVELRGTRRELRRMEKSAEAAQLCNMAAATAEGLGLGALGIGLPDIVLFTGVLLKGVYETALCYGFAYDTPEERMLILKMLEAAVSTGAERERRNAAVDEYLERGGLPCGREALEEQAERTARAFAADMLLLKWIQGLPVIGMLGGAGNPVCFRRVMKYVGLKYRKRYLLGLERNGES